MRTKNILFMLTALVIAGCSQSDDKKTSEVKDAGIQNNLCTEETVSSYNNINRYTDSKAIEKSCSKFKSLVGERSCKAQNVSSGAEETISYESVKSRCEASVVSNNRPSDKNLSPAKPLDPAIDDLGRCRDSVIYANNAIIDNLKKLKDTSATKENLLYTLKQLVENCDKFENLLKGRSCEAVILDGSNNTTTVSEIKYKEMCTKARELNSESNAPADKKDKEEDTDNDEAGK
ncbi:MAG: hypothetical protein ACOYOK_14220 [Pseudobdellovibrionaceae bacterium]